MKPRLTRAKNPPAAGCGQQAVLLMLTSDVLAEAGPTGPVP